jgi:sugar lactone lactonase YvrE
MDSSGNLYIADTGNNRVVKLTSAGVQTTLLSGSALVNAPHALAVDRSGNLYVADTGNNRILKLPSGGTASVVGSGFSAPEGVSVDYWGNVYIADTGNNRVVGVSPSGTQVTLISSTTSIGGKTLYKPAGISVPRTQNGGNSQSVEIADTQNSRVIYGTFYNSSGTYSLSGASFNFNQLVGSGLLIPYAVQMGATYNQQLGLVADTGNNRILQLGYVSQTNSYAQYSLGSGLSAPSGIATDQNGNVYIADTGHSRIVRVQTVGVGFGGANIGSTSTTQIFNFAFLTATTLNASSPVQVLTQGAPNLDFKNLATGSCIAKAYAAGSTCSVNVAFKPTVSGQRAGAVVLRDTSGNAIATVYVNGIGNGPQIAYDPGIQSTVATGLSDPRALAVDGSGNVYVADFGNGQIVKVTPAGVKSTFASIPETMSLAVDGAGNVYTVGAYEYYSNDYELSVLMVSPGGAVSTPSVSEESPRAIAVDAHGDVYVTDSVDAEVEETRTGGLGYESYYGGFVPDAVAVDANGNVYMVDSTDWLVWKNVPATGQWSTIGEGYNRPQDVAVDSQGNVYVADFGNNRVVKVTPSGVQSSVGTGLLEPTAVKVDAAGNIYIADFGNSRLVKINRSTPPSLSFASTVVGKTSSDSPKEVTVENIGNAPLIFPVPATGTNASLSTNFTMGAARTCPGLTSTSSAATLAVARTCIYQVSFTPKAAGSISGSLVMTNNNLNVVKATETISLSGTATTAAVAVRWTTPAPVLSGTVLTSTQLNATASVPGTFVYSPAAGTKLAKGTAKLTTTFTPSDASKYKVTTATVGLVVQ